MFCERCGKKLPEGAKFCTSCGHRIETIVPVQSKTKGAENKPAVNLKAKSVSKSKAKSTGKSKAKSTGKSKAKSTGKRKNKGLVVALCIILAILVIAAIVLGVVFIKISSDSGPSNAGGRQEKVVDSNIVDDTEEISQDTESEQPTESVVEEATETEMFRSDDVFENGKSGFIFPNSDTKKLTDAEIEEMLDKSDDPLWDIRIAINELYARHGRIFDTPEIREYFEKQDWYEGTIDGEEFDKKQNDYLNDIEIYNRDLLSTYRSKLQ